MDGYGSIVLYHHQNSSQFSHPFRLPQEVGVLVRGHALDLALPAAGGGNRSKAPRGDAL